MTDTYDIVACGALHSVAIKEDRTMVQWGNDGDNENQGFPEGVKVSAVSCGGGHSVAIKEDGTMVQWGNDDVNQSQGFPEGVKVKAVYCGGPQSVAIKEDGTMVQWGSDNVNQRQGFPEGVKVKAVSCGNAHSVAIKEDGTMVQWGNNDDNQSQGFPQGLKVNAVSCGSGHSVAIKEDGTMVQWGNDDVNQSQGFPEGVKVKAVYCGGPQSVAIKEDGTMVQWGSDNVNQRQGFPEGVKVKAVSCGNAHSVAIKEGGTMVQWGDNELYQSQGLPGTESATPVARQIDFSTTSSASPVARQIDFSGTPSASPVARQLDFSRTEPTLTDENDSNLNPKFTQNVRIESYVGRATAYPREPVFDIVGQQDVSIEDFLLEDLGNNIVFRHAGNQYGIPLQSILKKLQNGEALFYECTREFTMQENFGTFEFNQIYAKPYVEIALASRFYIPFENFQKIASIPTHVLWELTPTDKVIKNAASRSSVLQGGPIMSQLHCQAGSDLTVFAMNPFTLIPKSEPAINNETEEETFVNVKMGEEITQIDITDSRTFDAVRSKYAALKQMTPSSIQFIFGARIVTDYLKNVIPGVTILARTISGARRRTYKKGRKISGPRTRTYKKRAHKSKSS